MKEHYISFEIAQSLKRLGFDWECKHYYVKFIDDGEIKFWWQEPPSNHNERQSRNEVCSAPRLDQVAQWLREEHGIYVEPCFIYEPYFEVLIKSQRVNIFTRMEEKFNTYEQALSIGINEALKLLEKGDPK